MTTFTEHTTKASTVLFVDKKVSNYQELLKNLEKEVEVYFIDPDTDGILQIAATLRGHDELDSIQIISHGDRGVLSLGSTVLNNDNLQHYDDALRQIGSSLSENGDILLYGCNVAQGEAGLAFVQRLSSLTGADIAASADLTGKSINWELEVKIGQINTILAINENTRSSYAGTLGANTAPSFSASGVFTDFGMNDYAKSITLQSDGKIVVAGTSQVSSNNYDFSLARYNNNGFLDTTFGNDGKVTTAFGSGNDQGYAVTSQPTDGKIVVAGFNTDGSNLNFALARYDSNGLLDTGFGTGGKVTTSFGPNFNVAYDVAVQADGGILAVGNSGSGAAADFAIARYNGSGSLDTTFSGDGLVATNFSSSQDQAFSVAVQADGKILVAGQHYSGNGSYFDFALVRYTSTGTLDSEFGTGGTVITSLTTSSNAGSSLVLQPDGKILVAGSSGSDFALIRYNANGTLDNAFSSDGIVTTDFGASDMGYSVALQADNKIIVAGKSGTNFVLARYDSSGTLDNSFDGDGKVITALNVDIYSECAVAVQSDGKIVITGTSANGTATDFALVRYNPDGSLDNTFHAVNTLDNAPTYTENGTPVVLDNTVQVYDAELAASGNYGGATITLARDGGANSQDVFSVNTGGIGTAATNNGILTITFDSNATQTAINTVLSSIAYSNTSDTPPTTVPIDWTFNDGTLSVTGSTIVTITPVNDSPIATVPSLATLNQNSIIAIPLSGSDVDGSISKFKVTQLPSTGILYSDAALTQAITSNSEITAYGNSAQIYFKPDTDWSGNTTFSYEAIDNELLQSSAVSVPISVSNAISAFPHLINGLGGSAGFGEYSHFRNDDYQTDFINVTSAFASGIKFGGNTYNGLYVNNNGMLTFGTPFSGFVPNGLQLGVSSYDYLTGTTKLLPTIALHWTDLDTRYGTVSPSLGGTSMGTNLVYWDIDEANKNVTITWDDVGEYSYGSTPKLAGQIILHDAGAGNMDVTFRYEHVDSLNSHTVTAGWNVGVANGVLGSDYYAIPNNTNSTSSHDVLADLDTRVGNTGKVGIWEFSLRDGGIYVSTGSTTVFTEQTPVVVDNAITISSAGIWNNGTLAVQITANATTDDSLKLPLSDNGGIWLAANNDLMSGSTVIGSASSTSVSNNTAWAFTFNSAATTALVQSTARAIIFDNNSDTPNPTQRTVTFTATDSTNSPASSTQIIGVLKVNDAPTITLHGVQSYTQSGGAVLLDNSVQVHDAELDALNNYNGASVTLARVGSASSNDVFSSVYFAGSNVVVTDGSTPVTIGSVTNGNGILSISFNENATTSLVTQLLRSVSYSNSIDSGNVSLSWTFSDGNTSEQGSGGAGSVSGTTVVDMVNNPPTVSSPYFNQGISYGKEWSYDLQLASHFSDPESDTLTYSVTLANGSALPSWLTFADGFLTGTPPTKEFGSAYSLRITATDSGALSVDTNFAVTVLNFDAGNLFVSVSGADTITGTTGIDTISYEAFNTSIVASLQTGIVTGGGTDTLSGFENIIGTNYNDTLTSGDNMANVLVGNAGNDHYIVNNTAVEIIESINSGDDSIDSSVSFTLPANVEQLTLLNSANIDATGNNAGNFLIGNSGNNRLDGRGNTDTMQGGAGDDTYVVDNKNDVIQENANGGTDTVLSSVTYKLLLSDGTTSNNVENLTLTGRSAISGVGNSGNNIILGNAGANWLKGGLGVDTLTGGAGADKFKFDNIEESLTSLPDIITDFKRAERDKIELSSLDANSTTTMANEAFEWKGTTLLTVNFAGKLRYVVSGSDSIIEGYVNDDNVADFKIQVTGVTDLSAADFGL